MIDLLFFKPADADYYYYYVNTLEKSQVIERQRLPDYVQEICPEVVSDCYFHSNRFHTFLVNVKEKTFQEVILNEKEHETFLDDQDHYTSFQREETWLTSMQNTGNIISNFIKRKKK